MDLSIFTDKAVVPDEEQLKIALGKSHKNWHGLEHYVYVQYPDAKAEWKNPGVKHGWSFRLKDNKRVIIYLLPRTKYSKVAFMFGQKAYEKIIDDGSVPQFIRDELLSAKVYAEGRGIRIDITDNSLLDVIKFLVKIKLSN